jgi:hypothetical protein
MPVYNGEKYIAQAIESVLKQSFRDLELLIIDDGSTDKSAEIAASYADKRIRYVANPTNLGLAGARNRAIETSCGDYLAWLDSDDISLPERLRKQVDLLDAHPEIGLCGTWVRTIGLEPEQIWKYPRDPGLVRGRMLFDDPVATSAAMVRRSCLSPSELRFDTRFPPAEDYDLWERISRTNSVCNISQVLTLYRVHPTQISTIKKEQQKKAVWAIQSRLLQQLQVEPSEEEISLHYDIGVRWHFAGEKERVGVTEDWLLKLESANERWQVFPREGFRQALAERWFLANLAAVRAGQVSWRQYGKSLVSSWEPLRFRRKARLLLESMRHGR